MFRLYQEERRIFSFEDYRILLDEVERLGASNILEFGPGVSTLAFIESGCGSIVTCEHQDEWRRAAQLRYARWSQVHVQRYRNIHGSVAPQLGGSRYDLAFVDSPVGEGPRHYSLLEDHGRNRANTVACALRHSNIVLLHDAKRAGEVLTLQELREQGFHVSLIDTVKGFARIERK